MNELTIILVDVAVGSIWTASCIWLGFRFGRMTVEKPVEPIFTSMKSEVIPMEQDPYYEAMHGEPQPSTPTLEDRR